MRCLHEFVDGVQVCAAGMKLKHILLLRIFLCCVSLILHRILSYRKKKTLYWCFRVENYKGLGIYIQCPMRENAQRGPFVRRRALFEGVKNSKTFSFVVKKTKKKNKKT